MTKKRKGKQKRRKQSGSPRPAGSNPVRLVTYKIVYEPILDREYERLPDEVKEAIERLYHTLHARPRQAIPELQSWIEKYPQVPQFYNYLAAAYSNSGQSAEAETVMEENYRRNPDYLFARIHYGELCLRRGEVDRIPDIVDHKFDLKLLYPKRKEFHVSEVLGFMGLLGVYFCKIGQRDKAAQYYDLLKAVDPRHAQTKRLRRMLHPGFVRRLLGRWSRPKPDKDS